MSVVVAVKYKDGVAIAADKQATRYNTNFNNVCKLHNFKYSNSAIGTVGYLRDCNVIRLLEEVIQYKDIIDNVYIDELYVIGKIVPIIQEHMTKYERIETQNELKYMPSTMLYATSDDIYMIERDFAVITEDNYGTIGCGEEKVIGYMSLVGDTTNYNKEQITTVLIEAITRACERDVFINNNIDITFLEKTEINNDESYSVKGGLRNNILN